MASQVAKRAGYERNRLYPWNSTDGQRKDWPMVEQPKSILE